MPIAANAGASPAITEGQTCPSGNILNCKTYSNTRTCLACMFGYTLNAQTCNANIPNCEIYQS